MKRNTFVIMIAVLIMTMLNAGDANSGTLNVSISGSSVKYSTATAVKSTVATAGVQQTAAKADDVAAQQVEKQEYAGPSYTEAYYAQKECGSGYDEATMGERFDIVFGDDEYNSAFVDRETCLMWPLEFVQIGTSGYYTYYETEDICNNLALGGYTDWRIPDAFELFTLVVPDKFNPAHPDDLPDIQSLDCDYSEPILDYMDCNFWTSSGGANLPYHIVVDLTRGEATLELNNRSDVQATCVRGNSNAGVYYDYQ